MPHSATDTGCLAWNVYLCRASAGLATVVRDAVDGQALTAALGLASTQRIHPAHSVGWPG